MNLAKLGPLAFLLICLPAAFARDCDKKYGGITYAPFALKLDTICLQPHEVYRDMMMLKETTDNVRLYGLSSCINNVKVIMDFAKAHDMRVLLGLWVSLNATVEEELAHLPGVVRAYKDIIDAVVVGNEAVFVNGVDHMDLIADMGKTRALLKRIKVDLPVTTAEVWPTYESDIGPAIVEASDFLCMNIQPYWEGRPVVCPPDAGDSCIPAGTYVNRKADDLSKLFGKPVWICESGWPTEGERCCEGRRDALDEFQATPSVENARIFHNDLVKAADSQDRPYWIHGMFDGDWKRIWAPCGECEGLEDCDEDVGCEVDYHWGLYTHERVAKPSNSSDDCPILPATKML